jgi:hypothetical protein
MGVSACRRVGVSACRRVAPIALTSLLFLDAQEPPLRRSVSPGADTPIADPCSPRPHLKSLSAFVERSDLFGKLFRIIFADDYLLCLGANLILIRQMLPQVEFVDDDFEEGGRWNGENCSG